MADIQQQIADGARPLARVGDVIEHGEAIPANVRVVEDRAESLWHRNPIGHFHLESGDDGAQCDDRCITPERIVWSYGPLTVVEVDPEPQPAERRLIGPAHAHLDRPCTDACHGPAGDNRPDVPDPVLLNLVRQYGNERESVGGYTPDRGELQREKAQAAIDAADNLFGRIATLVRCEERDGLQVIAERDENAEWADRLAQAIAEHLGVDIGEHSNFNLPWQAALIALTDAVSPQPAESGPVVLALPQVPDGAVALVGIETGRRWDADEAADGRPLWTDGDTRATVGAVLDWEGAVTVEFAPPDAPRTWPKLDPPAANVLRVRGASGAIWTRPGTDGGAWNNEDHSKVRSWGALALEDGPLTEVPL